jgi:hypothetical protein
VALLRVSRPALPGHRCTYSVSVGKIVDQHTIIHQRPAHELKGQFCTANDRKEIPTIALIKT